VVARVWSAFASFQKRLQTHQEHRPLRAAVMHVLIWFPPALMFKEDDGVIALLFEIETNLRTNPVFGAVYHLPLHTLSGLKLRWRYPSSSSVAMTPIQSYGIGVGVYVIGCHPFWKRRQCLPPPYAAIPIRQAHPALE
jgi:hypothetical protein